MIMSAILRGAAGPPALVLISTPRWPASAYHAAASHYALSLTRAAGRCLFSRTLIDFDLLAIAFYFMLVSPSLPAAFAFSLVAADADADD